MDRAKTPAQDSLANKPPGMSFAQIARGFEFNADRNRKARQEAEDQVPELAPVSLGAYTAKFTRRGTRGKGGGTKKLDDVSEASSDEQSSRPTSAHGEGQLPTSSFQPPLLPPQVNPHPGNLQGGYVKYLSENASKATRALTPSSLADLRRSPPPTEGEGDYVTADTTTTTTTNPTSNIQVPVRHISHQHRQPEMSGQTNYSQYGYSNTASTPASSHSHLSSSHQSSGFGHQDARPVYRAHPQGYDYEEHAVYPQHRQSDMSSIHGSTVGRRDIGNQENIPPYGDNQPASSYSGMDDPFVNQPDFASMSGKILVPSRASVRMPPAVKGTMDQSFRFPHPPELEQEVSFPPGFGPSSRAPHNAHQPRVPSLAGQVTKSPEEYAKERALNDPKGGTKPHVRDPHPFTGFTAPSNKTEMLMQSLERLPSDNDVPNTGRTVLYDPMAQAMSAKSSNTDSTTFHANQRNNAHRFPVPLDLGRDLLRKSDPLPPMAYPAENMDPLRTARQNDYRAPSFTMAPELLQDQASNPYASDERYQETFTGDTTALTQEERDAELFAWFTAKNPTAESMRTLLSHQLSTSTPPNQRTHLAPIGSGRSTTRTLSTASTATTPLTPSQTTSLLAPAMANLHIHAQNKHDNPFTKYADPPAWCIDPSPSARDSLMGESGWNPPQRVGRDRRYPVMMHEGRPTYFEEVGRVGGRR